MGFEPMTSNILSQRSDHSAIGADDTRVRQKYLYNDLLRLNWYIAEWNGHLAVLKASCCIITTSTVWTDNISALPGQPWKLSQEESITRDSRFLLIKLSLLDFSMWAERIVSILNQYLLIPTLKKANFRLGIFFYLYQCMNKISISFKVQKLLLLTSYIFTSLEGVLLIQINCNLLLSSFKSKYLFRTKAFINLFIQSSGMELSHERSPPNCGFFT